MKLLSVQVQCDLGIHPFFWLGEGYDFGHLITQALTKVYPTMILFIKYFYGMNSRIHDSKVYNKPFIFIFFNNLLLGA